MAPSIFVDDAELTQVIGAQWSRFANATSAHNQTTTTCNAGLNGKGFQNTARPSLQIYLPSRKQSPLPTSSTPWLTVLSVGNAVTFVGTGAENVHLNYSYRLNESDLRQEILKVDKDLVGKVRFAIAVLAPMAYLTHTFANYSPASNYGPSLIPTPTSSPFALIWETSPSTTSSSRPTRIRVSRIRCSCSMIRTARSSTTATGHYRRTRGCPGRCR